MPSVQSQGREVIDVAGEGQRPFVACKRSLSFILQLRGATEVFWAGEWHEIFISGRLYCGTIGIGGKELRVTDSKASIVMLGKEG